MAKVLIGGTTYHVPEMNFLAVERSWPYVEKAMQTLDPIQGPAAGIMIVLSSIVEDEDFDPEYFGLNAEDYRTGTELDRNKAFEDLAKLWKRKLKATEIMGIRVAVNEVTREAGLLADEGELLPEGLDPGTLSMGTVPDTSVNSSPPDAKEEAGI